MVGELSDRTNAAPSWKVEPAFVLFSTLFLFSRKRPVNLNDSVLYAIKLIIWSFDFSFDSVACREEVQTIMGSHKKSTKAKSKVQTIASNEGAHTGDI